MSELSIRSYAYIGDAVYEVFAREKTLNITEVPAKLHKITSAVVKAEFHACILNYISASDFLTETEQNIVRRARNLSVTTARRTDQKLHRLSTAFEALVGYLHLTDINRLKALFEEIEPLIDEKLSEV